MSLLLTTNVETENSNSPFIGLNKPFQYHNYLTQPLKIPADSEVAVQSVKIVKSGNINLKDSNNVMYLYTGRNPVLVNGAVEMEQEISVPVLCSLSGDEFVYLTNPDNIYQTAAPQRVNEVLNIEALARRIQDNMNVSIAHPDLVPSNYNTSGTIVTVERETTGDDIGKFEGFGIETNLGISASLTNQRGDVTFQNIIADTDWNGSYNQSTFRMTKTSAPLNCEMIADRPMSLNAGVFKVDFKNGGGGWEIGLSRWCDIKSTEYEGAAPEYYDDQGEPLFYNFFDYVVVSRQEGTKFYLRIFHAVYMDDGDEDDISLEDQMLTLEEFEYWNNGPASASLTGPYEIFSDAGDYTASDQQTVKFTLRNERVVISVLNGSGTEKVLADGGQASKIDNLKPIGLTTKFLYPKMTVDDTGAYLSIETLNTVLPTNFDYLAQGFPDFGTLKPAYDFYAKSYFSTGSVDRWVSHSIDTRLPFNYGAGLATDYAQANITGDGIELMPQLLLAPPVPDGNGDFHQVNPAPFANAMDVLGFSNDPFPTKSASSTTSKQTYKSNSTPLVVSKSSLFVRLDNFNSETYNGANQQPSRILYHLPRFSNTGEDSGALFFEPAEKTYIKLNNLNELNINDFDLSICNADETFALDLTGRTIIMLHFRKSRI